MKKKLLKIVIIIFVIAIITLSGCIKEVTNEDDTIIEDYNPFYCKKILLRDDDVAGLNSYLPSLKWISNLTIEKDIKITFAIDPESFSYDYETVNYLNMLNRDHFEFAVHGFQHINLKDLPYEQQYSLIENATKYMEEYLDYKPFTFIPPYDSGDVNTTKALTEFGYHSITSVKSPESSLTSFFNDFEYETKWQPTVKHCSFEKFKNNFYEFYYSKDEYYIFVFHDWTFLDENGNTNITKTDRFEKVIDYIKNKNTQFMTIEEAYRRQKDENAIKTGKNNESSYYIDLRECFYNHTIKITPRSDWQENIYIKDETTGQITILDKEKKFFNGMKGHRYIITF